MQAHEIAAAVQQSARIDTHDHADRAVRATLTVLGQRLSTEARDLAAQLPPEYATCLPDDAGVERFDLDEFYRRVAAEEGAGCTPEQARQHARAVTAALREAVGAEYRHLLSQLPQDYADLVHTENAQH
ncbi:DUF2267 domain-containing protein [Blastococcus tunisiensis]|uniref:Uncharacterized conserved protein, DUF2267 family n=1 Tax=Blastococcus tunisiensis TaxID=1798228 RepID=A0A1I1WDT1_9ACTN|nr:DUF2267 domain-containing protein [Blastococcus sp. DSM 46838]SFD93181.1 Uncharacterized conserved protein, DUF2267 family [Blastococcus sp. DSM 46838]